MKCHDYSRNNKTQTFKSLKTLIGMSKFYKGIYIFQKRNKRSLFMYIFQNKLF